jgi:NAD(P)-dependent dehydrogenase (short-subunit alcohol dehydrogenase family)
MSGELENRTAIVTGAGEGIGRGIAEAFAEAGASVVLVGRTRAKLDAVAEELSASGGAVRVVDGTVADRTTAQRAVDLALSAFQRLDILVNNAHTFTAHNSLEAIPEADFRTELETGFFGTVHFMQTAFPALCERGGSVINTGSIAALQGAPGRATYAATKEAIRGLSRSAARDWGPHGIRVHIINPVARTPAVERRVSAAVRAAALAETALGYHGEPKPDIGPVAVFLAGDGARYVTGQTINADGGRWMF